ncbi:MAG: CpaE family protein [Vampirovibrionia bacterium]
MSEVLSVVIIDNDSETLATIKKEFQELDYINILAECENIALGYDLVVKHKPDIVIIDISENVDWSLGVIHRISSHLKETMIFVSSDETNLEVAVKAMRAGAREFLARPINMSELLGAVEKAKEFVMTQNTDFTLGSIFTVFSNKGGIGKTTTATNLAISLTEITGKRVALVDLNLQLGDVTTFLDIQPTYDISYIVKNISRVDEAFLLSTMEKFEDYELYVLADPPYAEQAEDISSEQINTVLTVLKSIFDYVIIDTTSSFDSKTLAALDLADRILLVSMVNLPCIRNTQRCLDLFDRLIYPKEKINLIINRYLPTDEISVEDVEDTLEHPVYWKIPNNYFTVMAAINRGVPINQIEDDSNISLNFNQLAKQLSGVEFATVESNQSSEEKKSSTSLLQSILNKV